MHRTMIYIEEADYRVLLNKARLTGQKMSVLVREAIHHYLDRVTRRTSWESDPVWSLSGAAKAGRKNADARNHDRILYGEKP